MLSRRPSQPTSPPARRSRATSDVLKAAEEELQECIAEGPKAFRGNEYQALANLRRLSESGYQRRALPALVESFQERIRSSERLRYGELQRKVEEVTECMDQMRLGPPWNETDTYLVKMLPFMPPFHRERILERLRGPVSTDDYIGFHAILHSLELLSRKELESLNKWPLGNPEYMIPTIKMLQRLNELAPSVVGSIKLNQMVFRTSRHPETFLYLGDALASLYDAQRHRIFDAAITLVENDDWSVKNLAAVMSYMNEGQYLRTIRAVMSSADRLARFSFLGDIGRHMDQLSDVRRDHLLFAVTSEIQDQDERNQALWQLAHGLPMLNPEQRAMVFDAVLQLQPLHAHHLAPLCKGIGLLDEARQAQLFSLVMSTSHSNLELHPVDNLALQIAHLRPAQIDMLLEHPGLSNFGLSNLIRGRSSASGEQRRYLDDKNIVETQVSSGPPDVWAVGLSPVMDLLSDDECHLVVDEALDLASEHLKTELVAGAGAVLPRLPHHCEALVQAAASMRKPENRIKAVVGMSRGMAHLSPEQCERLFEAARSASPNGRFDDHNIQALHALVTAEWPWSARWTRGLPPQPERNTRQISPVLPTLSAGNILRSDAPGDTTTPATADRPLSGKRSPRNSSPARDATAQAEAAFDDSLPPIWDKSESATGSDEELLPLEPRPTTEPARPSSHHGSDAEVQGSSGAGMTRSLDRIGRSEMTAAAMPAIGDRPGSGESSPRVPSAAPSTLPLRPAVLTRTASSHLLDIRFNANRTPSRTAQERSPTRDVEEGVWSRTAPSIAVATIAVPTEQAEVPFDDSHLPIWDKSESASGSDEELLPLETCPRV